MIDLKDFIASYPGYPKEGIIFRDITPLLAVPEAFDHAIDELCNTLDSDVDVIIAPESRGFIFGVPVSHLLNLPFIPVRKPGKLPGEVISQKYDLEYGSSTLEMPAGSIKPGQKVVIIDDLLATGGTVLAMCKMVEKMGGIVSKISCLIELPALNGRENLCGYNVSSIITFDGE